MNQEAAMRKKGYRILIVLLILAVFVSFLTNRQNQPAEQAVKEPAHSDVPYGVYYIYNSLPHFFRNN